MDVVKARWSSASFLHYIGAFVILGAAVTLLGYLSDDYGRFAFTAWSLLVFVVLAAFAAAYQQLGLRVVAGLFGFVALITWLVFIGAFFVWIHVLGADDEPIEGFDLGLLLFYLVAFVSALIFLARFRFPLMVTVVVVSAWFFVVDLVSNGGTWSAIVSIFVGLVFMLAGAVADRWYGFWLHFGAGLAIGGAFLYFWGFESWWEWILVGVVALFFLMLAAAFERSSYAVFGFIGLFLMWSYFVDRWTDAEVTTPFEAEGPVPLTSDTGEPSLWGAALLYALFGLVLVAIGVWFERRRGEPLDESTEPAV